jgi:hypothetical protein
MVDPTRHETCSVGGEPRDDTGIPKESFAGHLKTVRLRLAFKQITFSHAIGCTDAAISLWESGARFPTPNNLSRILAAIARGGGSTADILLLRRSWRDEWLQRRYWRLDRRESNLPPSPLPDAGR